MKNILILSGSFGGGHNSASNALKKEIEKRGDYNVQIVDALEYISHDINKFSVEFYNLASRKYHGLTKKMYYDTNDGYMMDLGKYALKFLSPLLVKLIDETKPSHIICTHPFATIMSTIAKKTAQISNDIPVSSIVTDYEIHGFWFGIPDYLNHIFVGCNDMKDFLVSENIMDENKIHVTGIPIKEDFTHCISEEKKLELKKQLDIKENMKVTIFFAGGALGLSNSSLAKKLNILAKELQNYHFLVISGKNDELYNIYENNIRQNNLTNTTLLRFVDNIYELMDISDFIVSKPGGLTSSEALAKGVGILIVNPLPGQEEANTRYIENAGAGIYLKDDNINEIISKIKNDDNYIKNMKENSKKLGKPYATRDIVTIILNDLI